MNEQGRTVPMKDERARAEAQRAVADSRRLFRRTLAAWVGDLLALRRAGRARPTWRARRAGRRWTDAA